MSNLMAIHPVVVETFHSDPKIVQLMVAAEGKSGDHQIHYIFSF